jgi:hypothetical protein
MKKRWPYLLAFIAIFGLLLLVMSRGRSRRSFDENITLRQADKLPYGTYAARQLLPGLFPEAKVVFNEQAPGTWDSIDQSNPKQAAIIVCDNLNADESELFNLLNFARYGNTVFIIARELSPSTTRLISGSLNGSLDDVEGYSSDSLRLQLEHPPFSPGLYVYPGRKFEGSFYSMDDERTTVLGRNELGQANFVKLDYGEGQIFIHLAPLAFSNYFILHKNNVRYYEQALSVIPGNVERVVWNEYYLSKPESNDSSGNSSSKEPDWFRVFMQYPSLAWGLMTAVITLLLMGLFESRRKQRVIPAHARPRNDSMDFIRTIGQLYYDRKDHHNLARKMSVYFLDHVRVTYKLPTHTLDEEFISDLHVKSGYNKELLKEIVGTIQSLDGTYSMSEKDLAHFYQQLELFYQNT